MSKKKYLKQFKGKKILITGHTGFKGSWLSLWLHNLGADILGVSDKVPTKPSLYKLIKLSKLIREKRIDIKNYNNLKKTILDFKPDFLFHLAAQPLVMDSYKNPILTIQTNTIGTVNILDIIKNINKKMVIIIVTSDKVYENIETKVGYKESDILGGTDPYSASKSMAEISIKSYFKSYIKNKNNLRLGIVRAGNVIGGGDWSKDRIIPDAMNSWSRNKKLIIRNPDSTRPWQHVLEPLNGYLKLAHKLYLSKNLNGESFNFGPDTQNIIEVKYLIKKFSNKWKGSKWSTKKNKKFFESKLLYLNCEKSKKLINWYPKLDINETVNYTFQWYEAYYNKKYKTLRDVMISQINKYIS